MLSIFRWIFWVIFSFSFFAAAGVGTFLYELSKSLPKNIEAELQKRNEILQMLTLEPKLAILDETDSGLDIDALKIVADGVNRYRNADRSFLVITHYQRLLKYIEPDFVHVLIDGQIVKSGGKELALKLEEKGYSWLES